MSNNKKKTIRWGGGISFWGLLQVAFIVMKVANIIDWPWIKVFLPTWIQIGIVVALILICAIAALITWLIDR